MATAARSTGPPARQDRPPGPKGHWFRGNLDAFRRERLQFFEHCTATYGDIVSVRLGPRPIWILNHPDLVEEVLVHQNRIMHKHFALRAARPTLGQGLLTSEGEFWRRQRRLAQPAFHRERIAGYGTVMVEATERFARSWAHGQRRDIQEDMTALTLEIVALTLFGADIASRTANLSDAMEELLRSFSQRVNRMIPIPGWLPIPSNRRFNRAMKAVDDVLAGIIAERRRSPVEHTDLLSMLLQATDDEGDGTGMTDAQLRDEAVTLFLAGHETTANTLAWAWYLLSLHPEAESSLHAELDTVLGDRPPTVADLPRLPYTEQVITETLRLYPTAWLLGREPIEPTTLGGYHVRQGLTLWMPQWTIHRDPRWYDEPTRFRPERWADGLAKRLPRYAYFPFGGGPRICIGNQFAMMEAVLILATLARRFRPIVPPGTVVTPLPTMTLRPTEGVPVVLEARRPA